MTFPEGPNETAKREVLRGLASVYDPLGVASHIALVGKVIYKEACDQHLPWEAVLPQKLSKQWDNFKKRLPSEVKVPRSLAKAHEPVQAINLHVFGDTSGAGTAAAMYAVVHQESGIDQNRVAWEGSISQEGPYYPKVGTCINAHGSQYCSDMQGGVCMDGQILRLLFTWLPVRVTTNSL